MADDALWVEVSLLVAERDVVESLGGEALEGRRRRDGRLLKRVFRIDKAILLWGERRLLVGIPSVVFCI